ncbi:helix-turn-helix domain-containing protein [Candidatus Saganbacteria bacterium]|nr:helix-turn-helix domain-containing protein [Candidatus Saganbacteria bacterium]
MNLYAIIGQQIKKARQEHDVGQKVLASMLGYTAATISQYENGKRCILLTDLEKIATMLNRPLTFFLTPGGGIKDKNKKGLNVSLKQYKMLREAHKLKRKLKEAEQKNSKQKLIIKKLESKIQNLMARIAEQAQITSQTTMLYNQLKNNEEKIRETEKSLVVCKTIKNVAYQLNNPFTVILGFIQMMRAETNHNENLERLEVVTKRCIKIISELTESVLPPPPPPNKRVKFLMGLRDKVV